MSWIRHDSNWFDKTVRDLPLFSAALERSKWDDVTEVEETTKHDIVDCLLGAYLICGGCWQYTEKNPCENCHQNLDENGQVIEALDLRKGFEIDDPVVKKEKIPVNIRFNGYEYKITWLKTIKNELSFCVVIGTQEYRVTVNPFIQKKITAIYNHRKRRHVSSDIFRTISGIANILSSDPQKHGLSHLKVFKS